jgi:Arabinose efflux permease
MPIWGPGSDRWGRRRTYLIGIVAFTVGSGLCAIARTMMEFIGARAIQGIGAGAVATLPFVLLGVVYPPNKRGRALGAASSAWAVASVAGPLLGTLIVDARFMALGFPDQRPDCHCGWVPRDRRNAREHRT